MPSFKWELLPIPRAVSLDDLRGLSALGAYLRRRSGVSAWIHAGGYDADLPGFAHHYAANDSRREGA